MVLSWENGYILDWYQRNLRDFCSSMAQPRWLGVLQIGIKSIGSKMELYGLEVKKNH